MRYAVVFGMLALLLPWHGVAAEVSVELTPGRSSVALRAYGMGLLPLDGQFTRFHGRFSYDPGDHAHCIVALQIDAASLVMASAALGEMVRGQDFLDVERFPALAYHGTCSASVLSGWLTMHGVTRPFALTLEWGEAVTAAGRLQRADWAMTARPLLGGRTVRITVIVPLSALPRAGGG